MLFNPAMERLASFKFASALATSGAIVVPTRDVLVIVARVTGYGGSDIASFRFNADATAANYTSSFVNVTSAPAIGRVNNQGTLGHIPMASTAMVIGRIGTLTISNFATTKKVIKIESSDEQAATTAATIDIAGYGEWLNTAAQITSITMLGSAGQTLSIGSGFTVFGWNL